MMETFYLGDHIDVDFVSWIITNSTKNETYNLDLDRDRFFDFT